MNNLDNIQNSGFKTPNNYFESLEDKICNAISKNSLKEKADKSGMKIPNNYLDNLEDTIMASVSKKNLLEETETGFIAPKNYFNTLENTIVQKIETTNSQTKVVSLFNKRNLLYISGIAAAIVLLFSLNLNTETVTFENLDDELVENYIIEQGIDSYEIASLLKVEDLTSQNFIDSTFNGEDLENYLLENSDIEELIIE